MSAFTAVYPSPLGPLLLASEADSLTGLWLPGQKYYAAGLSADAVEDPDRPILRKTADWLTDYFSGGNPDPGTLPLSPQGTAYQKLIWQLLLMIPFGKTRTYGQVAKEAAKALGRRTSARAVGSAVGRNPISIIIPCHRVLGASGALTGYAGGLKSKEWLLSFETPSNERISRSDV